MAVLNLSPPVAQIQQPADFYGKEKMGWSIARFRHNYCDHPRQSFHKDGGFHLPIFPGENSAADSFQAPVDFLRYRHEAGFGDVLRHGHGEDANEVFVFNFAGLPCFAEKAV